MKKPTTKDRINLRVWIQTGDWNLAIGYTQEVVDHPVLLMITDDTMVGHPMYQDLIDTHTQARKKWGV